MMIRLKHNLFKWFRRSKPVPVSPPSKKGKDQVSESIRKTCLNCMHYHGELSDPSDVYYHIHDYCDIWETQIPDFILYNRGGYERGFTDIESGMTNCHAFESKADDLIYIFPELGSRG